VNHSRLHARHHATLAAPYQRKGFEAEYRIILYMLAAGEGVETQGRMDLPRAPGCDDVQGFLPGRPQSAELMNAQLDSLR
jgi:hypothetical protein